MNKNEKGYFSVYMGIYPRTLFVVRGNIKKSIYNDNFQGRCGEELDTNIEGTDGSCVWSVIEKGTNKYGYLVRLYRVQDKSDLAHESVHVAFEVFRDIGSNVDIENQEPFAYLVEWITKQLLRVLNYKEKKCATKNATTK